MKKLDQVEQNALDYLNAVTEFTLPDQPAGNEKAAAIARVMASLVRKKVAVVVSVTEDTPPLPRWGITQEGRRRASVVQ